MRIWHWGSTLCTNIDTYEPFHRDWVSLNKYIQSASFCWLVFIIPVSYTLIREYRVERNRYSWLLFTSEDRLYVNLRVQEQLTNMISQCQYFTFTWRHKSSVVMSQCFKSEKTVLGNNCEMSDRLFFFSGIVCSGHKRSKIIHSLPWITIFGHLWRDLPMISICDFTRENHWQITSLMTKKIIMITHALFFIYFTPCGRPSRKQDLWELISLERFPCMHSGLPL